MKIRKVDSKSVILHEGSKVTLKTCGDSREVQFTAGNNTKCPIQNISKDKYLDKETGEIKEGVHQESRYQSPKSARKSIHRLMDLIRCNAMEARTSDISTGQTGQKWLMYGRTAWKFQTAL